MNSTWIQMIALVAALSSAMVSLGDDPVEREPKAVPLGAEQDAYRIEEVLLPVEMSPEISAVAFSPSGRLFVANRHGDIWSQDVQTEQWSRFAQGLHEPLGMHVAGDRELYVCHKPELTRLRDTSGDGRADRYDTVTDRWMHSDNWHEHVFGLPRDADGRFVIGFGLTDTAGPINLLWPRFEPDFSLVGQEKKRSLGPYQGWVVTVGTDGRIEPFACGFREPCGVAVSPDGEIFVTDQQGDYIAASPLIHVEQGKFYGHPASYKWSDQPRDGQFSDQQLAERRTTPTLVLPHGSMGGSPGQPVWDTSDGKFGPFTGQVFIGDFTKLVSRCDLQKVDGHWQGACFSFLRDAVGEVAIDAYSGANNLTIPAGKDGKAYFQDVAPRAGVPLRQGTMRMAFAPDGSLYLGQTTRGWGYGDGLQRVVWTGSQPVDLLRMRLTEDGFRLRFTTAMSPQTLADRSRYRLTRFRYAYHHNYGSPRLDESEVDIRQIRVGEDADRVELVLDQLHPGFIYELILDDLVASDGRPLRHDHAYYTLNRTHDGRQFEGDITDGAGLKIAEEKPRPPDANLGGRVYRTFCVQCHRPDGRGGGLPGIGAADFTAPDGALTKADAALAQRIAQGVPGKTMPQFGYVLSEQQILDVLAYIRQEFGAPAEPPMPVD